MHPPNVERVLSMLRPDDVVVDLGGWACPFNRADYVIDAEPYETRGYYRTFGAPASQGGDVERFSRERWIVRDLCGHDPYPFADKSVDFIICSHTLEDVRDPLRICAEMIRIAKRGYIEVPSRVWESCRGLESPSVVGLSHHRWLIDIDDAGITFLMKYHAIHGHWRYSLPQSFARTLSPEASVQWLFWDDRFAYAERTIHGIEAQREELAAYVARVRPYAPWRLAMDRVMRDAGRIARGVGRRMGHHRLPRVR